MLFKIAAPDRSSKKMIRGSTINEIITMAKVKFGLNEDHQYKLALFDDNTEIESDDILIEYVEEYKKGSNDTITLLLMSDELMSSDVQQDSNIQSSSKTTSIADKAYTSQNILASTPIAAAVCDLNTYVWSKAPARLINSCQKKQVAHPKDRKALVGFVADYIINVIKDTTRKICRSIAQKIHELYPDTFSDKVEGQIYGIGWESFMIQIYNAVLYRKKIDKGENKRKESTKDSDDEDEERRHQEREHLLKQDEYGCIAYSPQLAEGETVKSQEEKRKQLDDMFTVSDRNDIEISYLMELTYPTQRAYINAMDRDIKVILTEWPFLKDPEYLISHFNQLVGKNVRNMWTSFATTKLKPVRRYLKTMKYKPEIQKAVSEVIAQSQQAVTATRSDVPKSLVIFPLLLLYFQENSNYFFQTIAIDVLDENIAEQAQRKNPVLLIRGESIYDEDSTCTAVLEQNIIIFCSNVLEAILVVFISYFVFGYAYPPEVEKTLEYIQREIIKINPPVGSKRGLKRRKTTTYNAAVYKLAKEISDFQNLS